MKDAYVLKLFNSFPKVFNELVKMPLVQRLDIAEVEKTTGINPGELNSWILQSWGFNKQFYKPLIEKNELDKINPIIEIMHFSGYLAEFILNSWEGALLRMKASQKVEPLSAFRNVLKEIILK